jgi:hypothetical protein
MIYLVVQVKSILQCTHILIILSHDYVSLSHDLPGGTSEKYPTMYIYTYNVVT